MLEWNAVVTVHKDGFARSCRLLGRLGVLRRTHFMNVLVMKVDDVRAVLDAVHERAREDSSVARSIARISPASTTFAFHTADEFHARALEALQPLLPMLAGRSFHVRLHRRGLRGVVSTQEEERALDHAALDALDRTGTPGRIAFDDPDAIVAIETVDRRAGLAVWLREDLDRYPMLGLDRGKREIGESPTVVHAP